MSEPPVVAVDVADVDMASAARIERLGISSVDDAATHSIILDLSEVRFIDSSGVGALIAIRRHAVAQGGSVALARLRDQPERTLNLLGLLNSAFVVVPGQA